MLWRDGGLSGRRQRSAGKFWSMLRSEVGRKVGWKTKLDERNLKEVYI